MDATHQTLVQKHPINSLPDEILAYIFLSLPPPSDYDWREPVVWLIRATSVCHHWRQVALDTPRLWSTIMLNNVAFAEECLLRSKNSPLNLTFSGSLSKTEPRTALWTKLSGSGGRLQSLRVVMYHPREVAQILASFSKSSAPLLYHLDIYCQDDAGTQSLLPEEVVWSHLPSLTWLDLVNVFVPSRFLDLPRLTRLYVNTRHLTVPWLLETLRNAPNIQHLDARWFSGDYSLSPTTQKVVLPALEYSHFVFSGFTHTYVLDYITFTPHAVINLEIELHSPPLSQTWSVASLGHLIAGRTEGVTTINPLVLAVNTDSRLFKVEIYTEDHHTILTLPLPTENDVDACVRLCRALPFAKVQYLMLEGDLHEDARWGGLIPLFNNLHSIYIDRDNVEVVFDTLYNGNPSSEPFQLPHLTNIFLDEDFCFLTEELDDQLDDIVDQREAVGQDIEVAYVKHAEIYTYVGS